MVIVYEKLMNLIKKNDNIVFFGGAGVSTASNIPDFRSTDGLFNQEVSHISPEEILSHNYFIHHTAEFYKYYRNHVIHHDAKPNMAHQVLSELETMGKLKTVITQNIDGLHQKAGSKNVIELHGSVYRNRCMECHRAYSIHKIISSKGIPKCDVCNGVIKPEITLYQESLPVGVIEESIQAIREANLLIVGGTSLSVYPAAGLIDYFYGEAIVLINQGSTGYDSIVDYLIKVRIEEVFEAVHNQMK